MCWAACDRLANAAHALALDDRRVFWQDRADTIRGTILAAAWRPDTQRLSATFSGDDLDASLIQLLELRFLLPEDSRFTDTLAAVEAGLTHADCALGGTGGHPTGIAYGEGFTGNTCTEDLATALAAMGYETGLNLARLKAAGTTVWLAGMLAPRNLGPEYAQQFDGLYKRLADKYGVPLYPFFLDGVAQDPALNQADGMHPNPKGVDVVVDHLLPFVTKNLDTYASAHAAPVRRPARP